MDVPPLSDITNSFYFSCLEPFNLSVMIALLALGVAIRIKLFLSQEKHTVSLFINKNVKGESKISLSMLYFFKPV